MSLELRRPGTEPQGLYAKTFVPGFVTIGDYCVSLEDFLVLAYYVLTNTDLLPAGDPRLQFVASVQEMKVVSGHMEGNKRLESPLEPV